MLGGRFLQGTKSHNNFLLETKSKRKRDPNMNQQPKANQNQRSNVVAMRPKHNKPRQLMFTEEEQLRLLMLCPNVKQ